MAHEHLVYDMCETCLGQGVVVRTGVTVENGRRVMRFGSEPCPDCEGLGFLRATERTETIEDDED